MAPLAAEEQRTADSENELKKSSQYLDEVVYLCLLNEVFLLLDYISGRPNCTIDGLGGMPNPDDPTRKMTQVEALRQLNRVRYPPPKGEEEGVKSRAHDATLLLLAKDRLNRLSWPATGLSVAYTTMFAGGFMLGHHPPASGLGVAKPTNAGRFGILGRVLGFGGGNIASRTTMAARAYPSLVASAQWFRRFATVLMIASLVFTMISVGVSYEVAFGRALMQRFDALDKQKNDLAARIYVAEQQLPRDEDGNVPRLCDDDQPKPKNSDQPKPTHDEQPKRKVTTIEQQQLCDAFSDWAQKNRVAYRDLENYAHVWVIRLVMPRGMPEAVEQAAAAGTTKQAQKPGDGQSAAACTAQDKTSDQCKASLYEAQSEQLAAGVLAAFSTSILPVLFGLLGAATSVLRSIYNHVRDRTLTPRELRLVLIHLPLGLVAGVSVGLFFVSDAAPVQGAGGLAGGLTLSSSGIAFLAGYGVETVFNFFDNLLRRTFSLDPAKQASPPGQAAQPAGA